MAFIRTYKQTDYVTTFEQLMRPKSLHCNFVGRLYVLRSNFQAVNVDRLKLIENYNDDDDNNSIQFNSSLLKQTSK